MTHRTKRKEKKFRSTRCGFPSISEQQQICPHDNQEPATPPSPPPFKADTTQWKLLDACSLKCRNGGSERELGMREECILFLALSPHLWMTDPRFCLSSASLTNEIPDTALSLSSSHGWVCVPGALRIAELRGEHSQCSRVQGVGKRCIV